MLWRDDVIPILRHMEWADALVPCHCGQVNSIIKRLGGEPPLTDFIAWLWLGRSASDWMFLENYGAG